MEFKMKFYHMALAATLFVKVASANSYITPEMAVMKGVAEGIAWYADENGGELPTRWDQIKLFFPYDKACQNYLRRSGAYLEERYQFINIKLKYERGGEIEVVLIQVAPYQDERSDQARRILVARNASGAIRAVNLSEKTVQLMLKKAGATLTSESNSPMVNADTMSDGSEASQKLSTNPSPVVAPQATVTSAQVIEEKQARQPAVTWIVAGMIFLFLIVISLFALRWRKKVR